MDDLMQISYRILFLGLLAALIGLSMPSFAADDGTVGGPGAPTILEGRGAAAPLPPPSIPATTNPAPDETPADEVRSGTTTLEPDEIKADPTAKAAKVEPSPDAMTPNPPKGALADTGPQSSKTAQTAENSDNSPKKPWWHFW